MTAAEREREKETAQEYISIGFPKKNVLEISHFPGEFFFFFLGLEENTQFAEEETTFKFVKIFVTKFAINVEKSCWGGKKKKKKRINLLLKAMIHHNESEVRSCWTDGREYVSTSC